MDSKNKTEILQKIDAYVKGRLTPNQQEELWVELLKHPEYIEYLKTELTVSALIREKRDSETNMKQARPEENASSTGILSFTLSSWKIMAAAAVTILLLSILILVTNRPANQAEPIPEISVVEHLAAPEVTRSVENTPVLTPADSLMLVAFETAVSGNKKKADQLYHTIIERFAGTPVAAEASLNRGILLYNYGRYNDASDSFNKAIDGLEDNSWNLEKAYWFLANSHLQLGRPDSAVTLLRKLQSLDGYYRSKATNMLKTFSRSAP